MRSATWILVLVLALASVGFYFTRVDSVQNYMKLGLDLQGGVQIVLQAVDSEVGQVNDESLEAARQVIENRVNESGLSEPSIVTDPRNKRIIIQLAGEKDPDAARRLVGKTAVLSFVDPEGKEVLSGADVDGATAGAVGTNQYIISLKLKGEGPKKFADATAKWVGSPITIILDGEVISTPRVNEAIPTGEAQITGSFTPEEAKELADLISGGALPLKLDTVETRVVSATLGADSLAKSARAGVIAMALVVLFMLLIYRIPGLLANIALVIYVFLTMAVLLAFNAVFTLPGLAGILLSIGMAVDGNIIIFERIKDELKAGKGLRSSIDAGFNRAYSAILDGQVTTAIAGVVLYFLGTGPIKGFAITLTVGVLLSLFTAVTVSRWLIKLTVNTGWFDRRLFGVKEVSR